eukprot:1769507-Pleurochrysis_carterae.AAC.2
MIFLNNECKQIPVLPVVMGSANRTFCSINQWSEGRRLTKLLGAKIIHYCLINLSTDIFRRPRRPQIKCAVYETTKI